jgi:hypothetical protein
MILIVMTQKIVTIYYYVKFLFKEIPINLS